MQHRNKHRHNTWIDRYVIIIIFHRWSVLDELFNMPDNDNENIVITNYTENDIDQLSSTSGIIIDLNQRSIASLTNAPLSDLIDILDTTIKF